MYTNYKSLLIISVHIRWGAKFFEGFDFHCPWKSVSRTCLETIISPSVPPTPENTQWFFRALNMFGVLCWLKACTMASLLCWNVRAARAVCWQLVGQGCDYETFFSVLGGEKLIMLTRRFLSKPHCSWHSKAWKATQWGTRCLHICCQNSHPLPPLGRSLAGWFLGWWLGGSNGQEMDTSHRVAMLSQGAIQLHLKGQIKIVSGWTLPHL